MGHSIENGEYEENNNNNNDNNNDNDGYDSDSSLVIAANKSLSLTTSLSLQLQPTTTTTTTTTTSTTSTTSDYSNKDDGLNCYRHHHHHHQLLQCCPMEIGNHTTTTTTTTPTTTITTTSDLYQTTATTTAAAVTLTSAIDLLSDPREVRRYRVAQELLETEKKYCHTLYTIQDTFAEPLKKADILPSKDITTLFPEEVYHLYDKHSILQHTLRQRLASWQWQPLVGDVLARFTDPRQSDVLRLYTNYVNDFPEVLRTFRKMCRTSQPFTRFIKVCLDQPSCGGLDLGAFLLTPVQRIPRYILLIKQLLRYTHTSHLDYHHLHTCLDRLRDFLARLNDSMEHSFQMVHVPLPPPPAAAMARKLMEEEEEVEGRSGECVRGCRRRRVSECPGNEENDDDGGLVSLSSSVSSGYLHRHRHHHHHHHHHRVDDAGRSGQPPRRSTSSLSSPSITPPGSNGSGVGGSPTRPPQRSFSSVGGEGGGRASRNRHPLSDPRTSSLPRGSPTFPNTHTNAAPSCPPQLRVRSRSEGVATRRPLPSTKTPDSPTTPPETPILAPALSVLSVVSREARWKDMSGSEPFLADTPISTPPPLTPAPALSTLSVDGHLHTPPHPHLWTDTPLQLSEDNRGVKKKPSLRTSLRNMFNFKKSSRTAGGGGGGGGATRGGGEEEMSGRYWETTTTTSSSTSTITTTTTPHHHHHHHHNQQQQLQQQRSFDSRLSVVGDFVDEEGNPCSNV